MNNPILWILLSWAISQALVMQIDGNYSGEEHSQIDIGFGYRRQPDNHKPLIHHFSKTIFVICLAIIVAFLPILLSEVFSRFSP